MTKIKLGRPREHDYLKEAKELDEWSKKPDSTSIYQFTDNKTYLASELSEFAKREPIFAEALKKAKERIGLRREQHCSSELMNYGVWARSAHLYDTILDKSEDDKKEKDYDRKRKLVEFQAKISSQIAESVSEDVVRQFDATMRQLTKLQSSRSMAESNTRTECKS